MKLLDLNMRFRNLVWVLANCLLVVLAACDHNPLFDDNEIIDEKVWIKGTVLLDNGSPAPGAVVFLDGYKVGTKTNDNGDFRLRLPPGGGAAQGESGKFILYFYIGNFAMETAEVNVVAGKVADEQGDIGHGGQLINDIILREKFSIGVTREDREEARSTGNDTLLVLTTICEMKQTNVFFKNKGGSIVCGFLLPQDIPGQEIYVFDVDRSIVLLPMNRNTWQSAQALSLPSNNLPIKDGDYEYIPWTLCYEPDMPQSLKDYIGYDFETFSIDYLKVPYIRTGTTFNFNWVRRWGPDV